MKKYWIIKRTFAYLENNILIAVVEFYTQKGMWSVDVDEANKFNQEAQAHHVLKQKIASDSYFKEIITGWL